MQTTINRLMSSSGIRLGMVSAPIELNGMGGFGAGAPVPGADPMTPGGAPFEPNSQQGKLIGFDDEPENPDLKDIFEGFGDPDDDSGDPDDTVLGDADLQDIPDDKVQGLQADITNTIKAMQFGQIPEDFDVTDRASLQRLMDQGVRTAVQQSLNVVFKPVQLAMAHMASQMNQQIDNKITNSRETLRAQDVIEQMVPEINNPQYSSMVRSLDSTLKSKGKKPAERAKTIRKMLNQMGIQDTSAPSGSNRKSSGQNDGTGIQRREGKAALDSIFGAFNTK